MHLHTDQFQNFVCGQLFHSSAERACFGGRAQDPCATTHRCGSRVVQRVHVHSRDDCASFFVSTRIDIVPGECVPMVDLGGGRADKLADARARVHRVCCVNSKVLCGQMCKCTARNHRAMRPASFSSQRVTLPSLRSPASPTPSSHILKDWRVTSDAEGERLCVLSGVNARLQTRHVPPVNISCRSFATWPLAEHAC